jgi:polyhydroxybutyrate depolymerase
VVFIFHGHGSTKEAYARRWDVQKYWPEAIAVYPQGLPTATRVDPKGKKPGWQLSVGTEKNRDLKFVDAILETLREKHAVDNKRIYAAGLSNGGSFSYVLWSARPRVFAAYGVCAGILRFPENRKLLPGAVMHVAGEADHTAPYEEQLESMAKVREINDCKRNPVAWGTNGKLYAAKTATGAPFVSIIHGGGHGAPSGTFESMIEFFKENQRINRRAAE